MTQQLLTDILPRSFYQESCTIVAKKLLGKYLVREIDSTFLIGKIVEVEAYLAEDDPAAHNFTGKSERNKSVFGEAGHAYVHSSRHHHLIDIVTDTIDIPGSVLIRAIEPVKGIDVMMKLRNTDNIINIGNGPAKICQALDIKRTMDGIDLTIQDSQLFLTDGESINSSDIIETTRVGITKAADLQLRFYIKGSEYISKK